MASWQQGSSLYEDNPFADSKDISIHDPKAALISPSANGPSWLQEPSSTSNRHNSNSNSLSSSSHEPTPLNPEIPRMILYTRVTNLGLSVCMIISSIFSVFSNNDTTTGVLACYVIVFSCLLCCYETHLAQVSKFIALNFGFMYSAKSRAAFMIFLGTILFSFSSFGKIIGILMLANAAFNIYILFKYPGFDEAQKTDAMNDIKDYLASNPAFAQQIISLGVQQTASYAAENPDATRSFISSYFGASKPPSAPTGSQTMQSATV